MASYQCSRTHLENSPKIWLDRALKLEESAAAQNENLVIIPLDESIINCRKMIGWLERAFVLSFYYLLRHEKYQNAGKEAQLYFDSISQSIQEGGDTDTNACIVGGMLGALLGIKALPDYMVQKVVGFDCSQVEESQNHFGNIHKNQLGIYRPELLSTNKYLLKNIKKLIKIRPKGKVNII